MTIDIRGLRLKNDIFSYFQNVDYRSQIVKKQKPSISMAHYCKEYETLEWRDALGSNISVIESCAYNGVAVVLDPAKVDSSYIEEVEKIVNVKCFFVDTIDGGSMVGSNFSVIIVDNASWISLAYDLDKIYKYFFDPKNIQLFVLIG